MRRNIKQIKTNIIKIKFRIKNWIKVNYILSGQYSGNKNTRFNTSMLRWGLCDYSDAYIFVKGRKILQQIMMLKQKIKS